VTHLDWLTYRDKDLRAVVVPRIQVPNIVSPRPVRPTRFRCFLSERAAKTYETPVAIAKTHGAVMDYRSFLSTPYRTSKLFMEHYATKAHLEEKGHFPFASLQSHNLGIASLFNATPRIICHSVETSQVRPQYGQPQETRPNKTPARLASAVATLGQKGSQPPEDQ